MKIAIVYDTVTGNTKKLADVIYEQCAGYDVKVYNDFSDDILRADIIFTGSWTFKGEPSDKMKLVYEKLHSKKIFIFGTCGFGGSKDYYNLIFENTMKYIDSSNKILGYYFCPGQLPDRMKEKYEKMLENGYDKKIEAMIDNFNKVLDRPNDDDLDGLRLRVSEVLNASES